MLLQHQCTTTNGRPIAHPLTDLVILQWRPLDWQTFSSSPVRMQPESFEKSCPFFSFFLLWMLSPFRTMAVCWLARQCSMISYLAAGAFFSNFWCWLNFRAVVFFGSCRLNVCVGQRVVEDGGRHLGGVKFNCVCVDRHTVSVCVCVCEVWRVI